MTYNHKVSISHIKYFFFCFIISITLKDAVLIEANITWTPNKLIENYQNKKIVDTNNYLDLSNHKKEIFLIHEAMNSFEKSGYKVNIYLIDSIPENNDNENSNKIQAFLKEILQILNTQYNQDLSNTIVIVFAINDKILDFYKQDNFLTEMDDDFKLKILNKSIIVFENNKEFYAKALIRLLNELYSYYGSPKIKFILKLFAIFAVGGIFLKIYYVFNKLYSIEKNGTNSNKKNISSSGNFINYPLSRFACEYHVPLIKSEKKNEEEKSNFKFFKTKNNSDFDNQKEFILSRSDNNKFANDFSINITEHGNDLNNKAYSITYHKNVCKIQEIMKDSNFKFDEYIKTNCIFCLEPIKQINQNKDLKNRSIKTSNYKCVKNPLQNFSNSEEVFPTKSAIENKDISMKNEKITSHNSMILKESCHSFHPICLQQWSLKDQNCPVCQINSKLFFNKDNLNSKTISFMSFSTENTSIPHTKEEFSDHENFLISIQKIMHLYPARYCSDISQ